MPSDPLDSTASANQSLTPAEREHRARVWTWSNRALLLLIGILPVIMLPAGLFVPSLYANALERIVPIAFGFFIVYASLLLAALIALVRNRPNYPSLLRGVRVVLIGSFVLFCAMIGLLVVLFLWSLDIGVSTDVVALAAIGFSVVMAAFLITAIIATFMALMEYESRQRDAYRATHPRPS